MNWQVTVDMQMGNFHLDLEFEADAKAVILIGPNGSGKTTLMQSITGARRPQSGRIQIGNHTLFDSDKGIDLPPEKRRLGYVPQSRGLFPHLRAVDNVAFGWTARSQRMPREERRRIASQWLDKLDSLHLANRRISELSGGEQQQIALARALMVEPALLLLDEPLSALDASNRRSLRSFLVDHLQERQHPTLIVSHDLNDIMAFDAHILVLEAGRIVQTGSAADLSAQPASPFVKEFFRTDWVEQKLTTKAKPPNEA